jgi:3-deoxy-D-manno-octulosonic-acid transferase
MRGRRRWRRILRHHRLRRALCWLIHVYIRLVHLTGRWQVEGAAVPRRLRRDGRPFILAFWHGRLLMIPMAWRGLAPMHMLISAHRDGRIIADAVAWFGIGSLAGSTRHGGTAALRAMLAALRAGDCVGITPDGPRGPAMVASAGIVNLARLARVPIVPVAYAARRHRTLATWDRFVLALPFGRGVFVWGEPIEVAADLDENGVEAARRLVEARLNGIGAAADRRVAPASRLPALYRGLTRGLAPAACLVLEWRRRRGKEDARRLGERLGGAGLPRPRGPLLWVHAASVGEATAVLALIDRLLAGRPALEILVTTGTVTSARLLAARLPQRARHQFVPIDVPGAVGRFLDHWRPDLALWVESELWPNLVLLTQARGIPLALVNGRLSARSEARWRRWPGLVAPILGAFTLCLAQDKVQADRLRRLGAPFAESIGDLKAAAPPLPADPAALGTLRRQFEARPRWLAASTHPGEEAAAAAAHRLVKARQPGLVTLIAPRHPARGDAIAAMLRAEGLRVARRSLGDPLGPDTDIYLADTMGELGLFYRLAGIAFIGGSLAAQGGHNPFEAARLDCAIVHGPDMSNCAAMAAALDGVGAAETVTDAADLADAVAALLADPRRRAARAAAGAKAAAAGLGSLDRVIDRLAPLLDRLAPIERAPAAAEPPVLAET